MEQVNEYLHPYIDWLPPEGQQFLESGGWWLVFAIVAMALLLLAFRLLRALGRLVRPRRREPDWDRELRENLTECPLPVLPPADRRLTVYNLPARLRLVVVAPPGVDLDVDPMQVEDLLDLIVPGLGAVALHDRPRIRVWPGQLSPQGFVSTFNRCTPKPEGEEVPSRWVLVAGRAQVGRQKVLLGLGLWADEPVGIGRLTLEPHQWLDVLRLQAAEG